ncbi:MAG: DUF2961 domain-containing protein [Deltaproteobacteria bacterium]|nr:DUF2961 domain-containing protein [Deltaproteobacteria bacterium]
MGIGPGSLAGLAELRDFKSRRLSSWDRTGGNLDNLRIQSGETAALGEISGAGCVKHIWMTAMSFPDDPAFLTKIVFRCFWDGEDSASVEVPLGDFFGVGFGLRRNFVSLPLQMSPEDGKGFNCWFPMPFAKGARFEIENQGDNTLLFYYYIDYEEYGELGGDLARFHAAWNRRNPTAGTAKAQGYGREHYYTPDRAAGPGLGIDFKGEQKSPWREPNLSGDENYTILHVRGEGQYVGCVLNIDVFDRQLNDWYGEGDDMIFIDQEDQEDGEDDESWPPRLHGTGTEDYFNTAFCPTQPYSAPYHGITVYSGSPEWPWGGKNSMYRFHIEDPIRFEKSIRVTIETGHNNALANDYSSTAYWYQRGRREALPALVPVAERQPRPDRPEGEGTEGEA